MFDSIMEGRVNLLDEIVSDLSSPEEDKKKEDKPIVPLTNPIAMYYKDGELNPPLEMMEQVKIKKEYKPKKIAPKHCFIFDDISQEMKNSGLVSLCKKSRHFKASVYTSPLCSLQPQTIKQLDNFLNSFASEHSQEIR